MPETTIETGTTSAPSTTTTTSSSCITFKKFGVKERQIAYIATLIDEGNFIYEEALENAKVAEYFFDFEEGGSFSAIQLANLYCCGKYQNSTLQVNLMIDLGSDEGRLISRYYRIIVKLLRAALEFQFLTSLTDSQLPFGTACVQKDLLKKINISVTFTRR